MFEALAYSAQLYYDFLEKNDRALEKIPILKKEKLNNEEIKLILAVRRIHTESLLIRTGNKDFLLDGEEIKIELDETKGEMILNAEPKIINFMMKNPLELYSDLKFLVENVQKFYERNAYAMPSLFHPQRLKSIKQGMSLDDFSPIPHLDRYQNEALKLILSEPVSYVWGPPGSGKTKAVLLEALLIRLRQGHRVLLLAPTNTALEQILFAILPRILQEGYPLETVLRFGIPSQSFLLRYTLACDPHILAKKKVQDLFTMSQKNYKERLRDARVLAMTVDGFIKRYELLDEIGQVFLDEAPYTPLIKALCLGYLQAPLSLLGDHKQLGPVCEVGDKDYAQTQDGYLMRAWSFSALCIEEYCHQGENLLKSIRVTPSLRQLKQAKLLQSYRYGRNLTAILDKYVYNIGLQGLVEDTRIYYIDVGAFSIEAKQYESVPEAQAIAQISLTLSQEEALEGRDDAFVVITPFILQRRLILRMAGHLRDKVFTIHRSQGLEFDTVVLSPVVLHYYLTDSKNPNALQALNVAISRARKKIIIVCDVSFWRRQRGQFIATLLENAVPYS